MFLARFVRSVVLVMAALCAAAPQTARASDCSVTSTGMVPLNDLGAGLYHGFPGGLYLGGSNARPPAHEAAGVAIANAMSPLDTLGQPDPNGRIVLISIGMSNCTQEFSTFVPLAYGDPLKNPRVSVIDCAQGGQATQDIRQPTAAYWSNVASRLRAQGSSPLQAQVVWLKEARRGPTGAFPASAESLTNDLGTIVRILKTKLPNVKLVYFTSRIYAGYATTTLNPEPYAYESGFAVRWLIEAQIAGEDSLNFDPDAGPVEAPWLAWGPYLWADGLTPRSDGLTWACSELNTDGTHPSPSGRAKVADSLLAFFERDATTEPWFINHAASVPERSSDLALAVAPNPASDALAITFTPRAGRAWSLELLDLAGRRVAEIGRGIGTGTPRVVRWERSGAWHAGVYWVRARDGVGRAVRRVALLGP